MIDAYYWPTPNGWKLSIMLEECGVDYRIVPVDIGGGDQFKPEFLRISPNNRMPAIVDHEPLGGGGPLSIFESGAILEYLAEKTGKFLPSAPRERYRALQWLHWQMGNLGPMMGQRQPFQELRQEPHARRETARIRHPALRRRGGSAVWGDGRPACGERVSRRGRVHHRGHHHLAVGLFGAPRGGRGRVGEVPEPAPLGVSGWRTGRRWKKAGASGMNWANASARKRGESPPRIAFSTRPTTKCAPPAPAAAKAAAA